jgi:hypothetical protein
MAEISENTPQNTPKSPENVYIETKNGHKVHINTMNNLKPFPKGVSGNAAGKPVGVKSDKRKQWEALHESIAGRHTERFNRVLATLDDEKFMDNYLRILEYFKPRLQRAENINMNTQLDRVVLVASPDDIPTLPDNFDEDQEQDQEVYDITPDEGQSEGDTPE